MGNLKFSIKGMTCSDCARTVEGALLGVAGVEQARVNYLKKEAEVHGNVAADSLVEAVKNSGYQAILKEA